MCGTVRSLNVSIIFVVWGVWRHGILSALEPCSQRKSCGQPGDGFISPAGAELEGDSWVLGHHKDWRAEKFFISLDYTNWILTQIYRG